MPKLTHSEADKQVEQAMGTPTSSAMGNFQKFLSNRGRLPRPNMPRLPTEQIRKLPLK